MTSESYLSCPSCGAGATPTARFCSVCGSPVSAAAGGREPSDAGQPIAPAGVPHQPAPGTPPANRTVWPGEPAFKQALPASADGGHRSSVYDRPAWMSPDQAAAGGAPASRPTPAVSGPQPPLTSTIVSSFLLGPFGAIWANRAATEARERGHTTNRYWWAFALSWAGGSFSVFLASILLPIALLGIALHASGDPSSINAPVAAQQPFSGQGQGAGAGTDSSTNSGTGSGTDGGTGGGVAAGSDTTPSTDSSDSSGPLTLTGSPLALPSDATTCPDAPAGGRAAVGANTTCGFATNVLDAWQQAGSPSSETTVTTSSPATGQTYSMDCTATTAAASMTGYPLVTCTGGVSATVYLY